MNFVVRRVGGLEPPRPAMNAVRRGEPERVRSAARACAGYDAIHSSTPSPDRLPRTAAMSGLGGGQVSARNPTGSMITEALPRLGG